MNRGAWLAIGVLIGAGLGIFGVVNSPWVGRTQETIDSPAAKLDRALKATPEYNECAARMDARDSEMVRALSRVLKSPFLPDDPEVARAYVIEMCVNALARQRGKLGSE